MDIQKYIHHIDVTCSQLQAIKKLLENPSPKGRRLKKEERSLLRVASLPMVEEILTGIKLAFLNEDYDFMNHEEGCVQAIAQEIDDL